MALTQISTAGVKDDLVTAAKIADDAVTEALVADESVDEARLKISNAGTNGQYLQKQSGNTGGLTWADVPAGVGGATGVTFNDGVVAKWGTGNDLEIYHDATGPLNYIKTRFNCLKFAQQPWDTSRPWSTVARLCWRRRISKHRLCHRRANLSWTHCVGANTAATPFNTTQLTQHNRSRF